MFCEQRSLTELLNALKNPQAASQALTSDVWAQTDPQV